MDNWLDNLVLPALLWIGLLGGAAVVSSRWRGNGFDCGRCRYPLRGLGVETRTCPECGAAFDAERKLVHRAWRVRILALGIGLILIAIAGALLWFVFPEVWRGAAPVPASAGMEV
jgi:hypothetical protein